MKLALTRMFAGICLATGSLLSAYADFTGPYAQENWTLQSFAPGFEYTMDWTASGDTGTLSVYIMGQVSVAAMEAGTVSFNYAAPLNSTLSFLKWDSDGSIVPQTLSGANGSFSSPVEANQQFGFRLQGSSGNWSPSAIISGFTAPVPEAHIFAIASGAGLIGFIVFRRYSRRSAKAPSTGSPV